MQVKLVGNIGGNVHSSGGKKFFVNLNNFEWKFKEFFKNLRIFKIKNFFKKI